MSYHSWTVDGFGICVDDIEGYDEDSLFSLIHMAPNFEKRYLEWIQETFSENNETTSEHVTIDEMLEYEDDSGYEGLAPIICEVMSETEGIYFARCDDYNGVDYVLIEPNYPWSNIPKKQKNLTIEDAENIFRKYVNILTDKPVNIDYYSVENGG